QNPIAHVKSVRVPRAVGVIPLGTRPCLHVDAADSPAPVPSGTPGAAVAAAARRGSAALPGRYNRPRRHAIRRGGIRTMAVPPGVREATFADALAEMRSIVGNEWVFDAPEDLHTYRDFCSVLWGEPEERVASAAVAPAGVEEVQAVVRIANERGIPLYPISTGRNLGY